ncbi:MAG: hypothetical protein CVU41_10735 [Chloroflexi bacterium HGW-Chloroflexi-3]|nr:MAG: hypothetical protein CVU41_10735 [Chloroflexi bacterium HGW-Chloroflexi-3]
MNWTSAVVGNESLYDKFQCPHAGQTWHQEAAELQQKVEETTSKRVRELYRLDLDEILAAHDCHLLESGAFEVVFDEIKEMKANILANGINYFSIEFMVGEELWRNSIYRYDQRFYVILTDYEHDDDLKDYSTFSEAFANPLQDRTTEFTTAITSSVFSVQEINA